MVPNPCQNNGLFENINFVKLYLYIINITNVYYIRINTNDIN